MDGRLHSTTAVSNSHVKDNSPDALVRELRRLTGEVEQLSRQIETAVTSVTERRKLGVDRRRHSRTDRRRVTDIGLRDASKG